VPPLYVLFLLVFYQLMGQIPAVVVTAQIILNLIGFLILIRVGELIFGADKLPRFLPTILVCDIVIWVFSAYLLSETLYIFLSICCIYFVIGGVRSPSLSMHAAGGVFAGLSLLTRPTGISLIASMIPLVWLSRRHCAKPIATWILFLLAGAVACAPWAVRNYISLGKLTPLTSADRYFLYSSSLPSSVADTSQVNFIPAIREPDASADSLSLIAAALENIADDPTGFIARGLKKTADVWYQFPGTRELLDWRLKLPTLFLQWGILAFAAIGFFGTPRPTRYVLIAPAVGITLLLFFTYATTRYIIPVMPFILILSARGLDIVLGRIRTSGFGKF
jgi:hypothetical protein